MNPRTLKRMARRHCKPALCIVFLLSSNLQEGIVHANFLLASMTFVAKWCLISTPKNFGEGSKTRYPVLWPRIEKHILPGGLKDCLFSPVWKRSNLNDISQMFWNNQRLFGVEHLVLRTLTPWALCFSGNVSQTQRWFFRSFVKYHGPIFLEIHLSQYNSWEKLDKSIESMLESMKMRHRWIASIIIFRNNITESFKIFKKYINILIINILKFKRII